MTQTDASSAAPASGGYVEHTLKLTSEPMLPAGQGFLDYGDHAHIARNESGSVAQNVLTYFAPPGSALRIDEPKPGNCPS